MNPQLSKTEMIEIEKELLPSIELLQVTGRIKSLEIRKRDLLQKYHRQIYGYSFDEGCPGCIADALRLVGNIYRLNANRQKEEDIPQAPEPSSEIPVDQPGEEITQDPAEEIQEEASLGKQIRKGLQNVGRFLSGKEDGNE